MSSAQTPIHQDSSRYFFCFGCELCRRFSPPMTLKWGQHVSEAQFGTTKEAAYQTLVRPQLEYAAMIYWHPYNDTETEKVVKVHISQVGLQAMAIPVASMTCWPSLEDRRLVFAVWPIPFLINTFAALKGSQFYFYFINFLFKDSLRYNVSCLTPAPRLLKIYQGIS